MKPFPAGLASDQVAQAQAGDQAAFGSLYELLHPWSLQWVERHFSDLNDVEDVVQSFWLHLLENECACLRQCRDPHRFPAWLEQSLANWCRDEWDRQQRTEQREGGWPAPAPED